MQEVPREEELFPDSLFSFPTISDERSSGSADPEAAGSRSIGQPMDGLAATAEPVGASQPTISVSIRSDQPSAVSHSSHTAVPSPAASPSVADAMSAARQEDLAEISAVEWADMVRLHDEHIGQLLQRIQDLQDAVRNRDERLAALADVETALQAAEHRAAESVTKAQEREAELSELRDAQLANEIEMATIKEQAAKIARELEEARAALEAQREQTSGVERRLQAEAEAKIAELQDLLAASEARVDGIQNTQDELAHVTQQVHHLQSTQKEREAEISWLTQTREEKEKDVENLKKLLDQAAKRAERHTQESSQEQSALAERHALEIQQREQHVAELNHALREAESFGKQVRDELKNCKSRIMELEQAISIKDAAGAKQQEQIQQHQRQVEALKDSLQEARERLASVEEAERAASAAAERVQQLERESEAVRLELADARHKERELGQQVTDLTAKLEKTEQDAAQREDDFVREKGELITSHEQGLRQASDRISELQSLLDGKDSRLAELAHLEEALAVSRERVHKLGSLLGERNGELRNLRKKLAAKEQELSALRAQLAKASDGAQRDGEALSSEKEEMMKFHDEAISRAADEIMRLKQELDLKEQAIAEAEATGRDLELAVSQSAAQVEELRTRAEDRDLETKAGLEAEFSAVESRVSEFQAELEAANEKLAASAESEKEASEHAAKLTTTVEEQRRQLERSEKSVLDFAVLQRSLSEAQRRKQLFKRVSWAAGFAAAFFLTIALWPSSPGPELAVDERPAPESVVASEADAQTTMQDGTATANVRTPAPEATVETADTSDPAPSGLISEAGEAPADAVKKQEKPQKPGTPGTWREDYIVKRGDSLWEICRDRLGTGTEWERVAKENNLVGPALKPGQKLVLTYHKAPRR